MSKRGDGRNCVSIVRVFPTLASSNTVDVELTAFNEDINFIDETDATDQIEALIDGFIDVDFKDTFNINQDVEQLTLFNLSKIITIKEVD